MERQVCNNSLCGLGFAYIAEVFGQQNLKSPTFGLMVRESDS